MRIFVRLLRYALRHKAPLALAFALGLLGVAVDLARPWPVKVVVDNALAGEPLPPPLAGVAGRLPGAGSREGVLAWCVAAALLLAVAGPALSLALLNVSVAVAQRLVYDLSRELFEKLQRLSLTCALSLILATSGGEIGAQ